MGILVNGMARKNYNTTFIGFAVLIGLTILIYLRIGKSHISSFCSNNTPINRKSSFYETLQRYAILYSKSVTDNILEKANGNENAVFYKSLKPEAHCPLKTQIGGNDDGSKLVCNPKNINDGCTIISLGLSNQIMFDEEIQAITSYKCKIIGVDKDEQNSETQKTYKSINGKLVTMKISAEEGIESVLEDGKTAEMLKIDIEGAEFQALIPFLEKVRVCQIFIEIHGTPKMHLNLMQKIAKNGYRLFSIDENKYCPSCCEYSYIHEDCMDQYEVIPLAQMIPQSN
ncbi:unnamed protein product [Caenorhabditis bovis]|uniref:Methyltransferase domain-containing protein n=1 Tax=Caenorhabditis bovis TaxID=2654633 RepID=A0A8S1FD01_9PELO|nr:unnamed protein product [Caenorhabditis bovis]